MVEVPLIEPVVVTTGHHCLEQTFSGGVSTPFSFRKCPAWTFFFQLWWIHLLWIVFSQYHPHSVSISIEMLNLTTVSVCNSAFVFYGVFSNMCTSNAFMPPNVRITPAIHSYDPLVSSFSKVLQSPSEAYHFTKRPWNILIDLNNTVLHSGI